MGVELCFVIVQLWHFNVFYICCLDFYVKLLSTVVILVLHQMDSNMAYDIGLVNLCRSFVIHNIT